MILTRNLLTIVFVFLSGWVHAQVQACIDVRAARNEDDAWQGVYDFNNKWTPGTTIKVSFLNGTEWQHEKVEQYVPAWSKYANIKFEFLTKGVGDVRISFNKQGSYSYIGTDAKNRPAARETMNLGWINDTRTEEQLRSVILHEFGHALGLLHEHMNPLSNIKWNKPVVYAYYLQYEGWEKDMVDKQVFDRYSVSMTNKSYDPKSIMHYPVPADFTLDQYSVGENTDLSANDKKLIAELYPFNKEYPVNNKTALWSKLQDLQIDYNATENDKPGIRIKQNFLIYNAQNNKCIMSVYFYDADNSKPLVDKNGIKSSADGKVASYVYFTPGYAVTQYKELTVFLPYDELDLGSGSFRLKCYVALFDPSLKLISSSGYQYFTYANGINSKEIQLQVKCNDASEKVEITPTFTIENAKNIRCTAVAYFYDKNGIPLKDNNNLYTTKEGNVSAKIAFQPSYSVTLYNNEIADFKITLPYKELHLEQGNHSVQCKVVLYDDRQNKIQESELYSFKISP